MIEYCLGLDLGQSSDSSALAIIETPYWIDEEAHERIVTQREGWVSPSTLTHWQREQLYARNFHQGSYGLPTLALRHLQRWPLRTPYPEIVADVATLLQRPPLNPGRTVLVVDKTGVGAPVVDLLRQAGCRPLAVTITAGTNVQRDPLTYEFHVPKRDLVSTVAVLLEQKRLQIAESLPEASTLTAELQNFRRKVTPVGNDTYAAWRESQHDDLVLATAMAAWYREYYNRNLDVRNAQQAKTGMAVGPA